MEIPFGDYKPVRLAMIAAFVLVMCLAVRTEEVCEAETEGVAKTLQGIVQRQAADWNRGDIESFMQAYWNSDELTFSSGGKTQRGWKVTRQRYLERYSTKELMGKLTFSELEVRELGPSAAMMLGRWHLDRAEPIGGNFTLIWKEIDSRWLIVHDHTSATETVPAKR